MAVSPKRNRQAAELDNPLSLRSLIRASGKTQAQLAEALGVDPTYISQMVNGKVNWVNSAYFSQLVDELGLTFRQIESLRPDAVMGILGNAIRSGEIIATSTESSKNNRPMKLLFSDMMGNSYSHIDPIRNTSVDIPEALEDMIRNNSNRYPELEDLRIQHMLAAPRQYGGVKSGPQTEDEWLEYWITNRRWYTR